jgi:hypothetical protein
MLQKGHWTGQYTFDNQAHNNMRGFDQTTFNIEIISVTNGKFSGKVQDDLSTGGTEGVGEIIGTITCDHIEFVKQMPVMTLLVDKKGTRKTFNRKHRKIYYSGVFSKDFKSISGHWKFRFGFIWFGIIPIPIIPSKGRWTMTLKE